MASYRPFPPPSQSTFAPLPPPNQNPLQPTPPPAAQPRGNQWGYGSNDGYSQMHPSANYQHAGYGPASQQQQQHFSGRPPQARNQVSPPPPQSHQQQYQYPHPPPRPQPVLPAPMYYPSSQYSQHQPLQPVQPPPPPPPPSSPPPSSAIPPPPPPSSPPPPPPSLPPANQSSESRPTEKVPSKDRRDSGWHESMHGNQGVPSKQHKPPAPHVQVKKANAHPGRVETEEERRLRKKREFEKQRQEEKHRQNLKESQNRVLQKTQTVAPGMKDRGPISLSHMADRKTTSLLSGERIENRLKKPTTFLCKLK